MKKLWFDDLGNAHFETDEEEYKDMTPEEFMSKIKEEIWLISNK